ncbi:MAG: fluoride efflux transporter CrcB [Candidatus Omnitrophica bacterium]|nr:fluoride efflux transporter CrcB [Candidatus Omnitrophota bacterium]
MNTFLVVFIGGGLGSTLRFLLSTTIQRAAPGHFPLGTFTVNLIGCFVIGVLWALSGRMNFPFLISAFLFAGILGGFTTFSSFGIETFALIHDGAWRTAAFYMVLTNLAGLSLAAGGFAITELLCSRVLP